MAKRIEGYGKNKNMVEWYVDVLAVDCRLLSAQPNYSTGCKVPFFCFLFDDDGHTLHAMPFFAGPTLVAVLPE